ncbi:pyridoxamine 5'-phosphate oxidase family protein [Pollutibacter soli]|uniref:pyridoxamine 5'-phosphate oxidase family protein n=1 Tax=Pollutibacter soli TaxID=3034157 RepID=UPI0030132561
MLGTMTQDRMKTILASQVLGRLGCVDGGKPYIIPVTYMFDGKYIYGQTNEGKKLSVLRKNPHVCFEVDLMLNMRNWESVIVYGTFEELKGVYASEARDLLFDRVYPLMASTTIHPHEHEVTTVVDVSSGAKYVMYRIKIEKMTGRFER